MSAPSHCSGNLTLVPSSPAERLTVPTSNMTLSVPTTGSATGNPRNKVQLTPGHSLMDWIHLGTKKGKALNGCEGRTFHVTPNELAKHNTINDAWTCIRGNVYNITEYLDFHPGGVDEIMRGAGIDGTDLFNEIHKWVNAESMLAKCYIGKLESVSVVSVKSLDSTDTKNQLSVTSLPLPPVPRFGVEKPRYEWIQNDTSVSLIFYTKSKGMRHENITILRRNQNFNISVRVESHAYNISMVLEKPLRTNYRVKVSKTTGKVEVVLLKEAVGEKWNIFGTVQKESFKKEKSTDWIFTDLTVSSVNRLNHDVFLYGFDFPNDSRVCIPMGYHVYLKSNVEGEFTDK